jgi:hypothetical protein
MIEDPLNELGQRLLAYEPADPTLNERYRREVDRMLGRSLRPRRWRPAFVAIFLSLMGVLGLVAALRVDANGLGFLRWPMILYGACMLIGGALAWSIERGSRPRRSEAWTALFLLPSVAFAVAFLNAAWWKEDPVLRGQLTLAGQVMLGVLGVSVIVTFVEHYFRRVQMKLLEIEYRVADLERRTPQG